jgi:hypothetical protein
MVIENPVDRRGEGPEDLAVLGALVVGRRAAEPHCEGGINGGFKGGTEARDGGAREGLR